MATILGVKLLIHIGRRANIEYHINSVGTHLQIKTELNAVYGNSTLSFASMKRYKQLKRSRSRLVAFGMAKNVQCI